MPRCRPASVCPHVSARLSSRRSPSAFLYVYLALRLAPLSRRCVSACVPVRLLLRLSSLVCVFAVCLPLPGCRVCLPVCMFSMCLRLSVCMFSMCRVFFCIDCGDHPTFPACVSACPFALPSVCLCLNPLISLNTLSLHCRRCLRSRRGRILSRCGRVLPVSLLPHSAHQPCRLSC